MIKNDKQLGTPFVNYTDTKSSIEALSGVRIGATAVATDNPTAPFGIYINNGWHWYTTGSVSGASLAFQDEGIPLGTPGTVNFVGSPVSVTVSGTVARVFITGSASVSLGTASNQAASGTHTHNASDIVTGTMATARLGSGTASTGTFLRGDQTWFSMVYLLPFSSYNSLGSPISASPAFPYAATFPSFAIYPKRWSQGVLTGATNSGVSYWKLELLYTSGGSTPVAATLDTSALAANTTAVLTTTTFDLTNYTQSLHIRFAIRCTKIGTPSNLDAHGPSLEYGLA